MRSSSLAFAIAATLAAPLATADVTSLLPANDASLFEPDAPEDQLSGGGGSLFVGRTGSGRVRRAMLRFDVAAAIPAGSTITSARLSVSVTRTQAPEYLSTLHRIASSWGEGRTVGTRGGAGGAVAQPGDATWSHRFWPNDPWITPGGDFDARPLCTLPLAGNSRYSFSSEALTAAVQDMLDHPEGNHGLLILGDEISGVTAKRIAARESSTAANRPTLLIEYRPACIGDWNLDGGIDGDDVIAFFLRWDNGDADVNGSGTTDFEDLVRFMTDWDRGCT
jgi:hypothetical protein